MLCPAHTATSAATDLYLPYFFMQRKIAIAKSEEMVGAILRKDAHDDEIAKKRYN